MSKIVKLYKIGKSEHKRGDLINSYFSFIELLRPGKIYGMNWGLKKEICEIFTSAGIYVGKNCSGDVKIGREKSLFESLNLIEKSDEILPSEFSKKIIENSNINPSKFGISADEYHFLLIVLFQESKNNLKQTFEILKNIINEREYVFSINDDMKTAWLTMDKQTFISELKTELNFSSGGKNKAIYRGKEIKISEAKNIIIEAIVDWYFKKKSATEIINLIIEMREIFEFSKTKDLLKNTITPLIIKPENEKSFFKSIDNNKFCELDFPTSRIEMIDRSILRTINGSYSEYKNLIHNHLNVLQPYFNIENNKIFVKPKAKEFISMLIAKEEELIKEFSEHSYISIERFKEIIEIKKTLEVDKKLIKDSYFENYGTIDKIVNILENFIIETNENKMREKVDKYIKSSSHLKGLCDAPTFFEFISSYSFIVKNYDNLFEETPEEFTKIIKDSLNLNFNNDKLVPLRFAAGGRADAVIKTGDGDIMVEPTLQLKRQTKMELDSVADHVNDYKGNLKEAYIIAPEIEKRLKVALAAFVNEEIINVKAFAWNVKELIEYLNS